MFGWFSEPEQSDTSLDEIPSFEDHNGRLLMSILDAAVYRMTSCPLAAEILSELRGRDPDFEQAKHRYVIFMYWCVRRSVIAVTGSHPNAISILNILDTFIQYEFEQMLAAYDPNIEIATNALKRFDESLDDDDDDDTSSDAMWRLDKAVTRFEIARNALKPFDESLDDNDDDDTLSEAMWRLDKAATSFIFGANFDGVLMDPDNFEKWAYRFSLPSQIMIEVVAHAKPILADLRYY